MYLPSIIIQYRNQSKSTGSTSITRILNKCGFNFNTLKIILNINILLDFNLITHSTVSMVVDGRAKCEKLDVDMNGNREHKREREVEKWSDRENKLYWVKGKSWEKSVIF